MKNRSVESGQTQTVAKEHKRWHVCKKEKHEEKNRQRQHKRKIASENGS